MIGRWLARATLDRGTLLAAAGIVLCAAFLTALSFGVNYPPGADTPGHLFKAWAIARGAESQLLSDPSWTPYWYNGHPLYYYYPPATYFAIGAVEYVVDNLELSYRIFICLALAAAGGGAYLLARLWFGRFLAVAAALAFQLSPYGIRMMYQEGNLPRVLAMALIPLLVFCAVKTVASGQRRYLIATSIITALLVLVHQLSAATSLILLSVFLAVYASGRARVDRIALAGVSFIAGLGLAFFWLYPASTASTLPDVPHLSLLVERLPNNSASLRHLLDPLAGVAPGTSNGYLGLSLVLMSAAGLFIGQNRRLVLACWSAVAVGVVFALGQNTPIYDLPIPMRGWLPERFLQPASLFLALGAAAGLHGILQLRYPVPVRLGITGLAVLIVLVDVGRVWPAGRDTRARQNDQADITLASQWIAARTDDNRVFVMTGRDYSASLSTASVAGRESTNGHNSEGTPHVRSIGLLNSALAHEHDPWIVRTLEIWNAGYALTHAAQFPRLASVLESAGWEPVPLAFTGEFALHVKEPVPGRFLVDALPIAGLGEGGGQASLVVPGIGEANPGMRLENVDQAYLENFDRLVLFGHGPTDIAMAEAAVLPFLDRGGTVVEVLDAGVERALFGVELERLQVSGDVSLVASDGRTFNAGPFSYQGGPWTGSVIVGGAVPMLTTEVDGLPVTIAAERMVSKGRVIYVGLSLMTQALDRDDPGAREAVRAMITDGIASTTARNLHVRDVEWRDREINFRYSEPSDTSVLISLTYFPGWRAMLDGAEARLFRHERLTLMRLPAGDHTVRLSFDGTETQAKSGLVTVGTIVALTAFGLWPVRSRKDDPSGIDETSSGDDS